ncbi:MAG: carboxymuconolactone decarboxylase family protein, partial [Deltaproteobacteria bacterium]|nr:carboxymuconolactone decarboxylase family protein [Deltaproteobacteria bacterium]
MASRSSGQVPRVYTVPELVADLGSVLMRAPALWAIWMRGRLPRALREQIIVAVARVNACRMCEHAHTRMALEAGVSDAELAALEGMDPSAFNRRTWLAIGHARERTKAEFAPIVEDASQKDLGEALDAQTRNDVEDVARVMTVANRIANTLNALPDRCRGKPVPESR